MALDLFQQTRLLLPWFTEEQARVYADAWAETGNPDLAITQFRANPNYDRWYIGNRRPDGTVHLTEFDYASVTESYSRQIAGAGITPSVLLTPSRIQRLIESGTSADEFGEQVAALRTGVAEQGDLVREAFGRLFGLDTAQGISDAAIFAAAFDASAPDDLTRDVLTLQRDISAAQISAEGQRFGFGFFDPTQARGFVGMGLGQEDARRVFSEAQRQIPRLNDLIGRFDDPSDPLDLQEFVDAIVLRTPDDLATIERLFARSKAQFAPGSLFALGNEEGVQALRG